MSLENSWKEFHTKKEVVFKSSFDSRELEEFINISNVKIIDGLKIEESSKKINAYALGTLNKINSDRDLYLEVMEVFFDINEVILPSPISGEKIKCISSFGTQLFNFLLFYDCDEYFYIIQNHQIVAGVYFPSTEEYFKFSGGDINGYLKHLKRIFIHREFNLLRRDVKFVSMFSCSRPWHFFYNQATALSILSDKMVFDEVCFFYIDGGDFLHPKIIDSKFKYKKTSVLELNKGEISPFLIGISFDSIVKSEHDKLKTLVLNNIEYSESPSFSLKVWVGITSQKRSWVEQVEAISEMIKTLVSSKIPIHIYFDGWTSPITPSSNDFKNIESDRKVINEIMLKTESFCFEYDVLVGKTAEEKITYALGVDFYISNYASGSIFVSRFAGALGLSHLNNNMNRNHHIHYNNTEIDKKYVKDLYENGKVGHHVSYSISVEDFMIAFREFYMKINLGDLKSMRIN